MPRAKPGDTVKIHYVGRLDNDTVFDRSFRDQPLEITLGRRRVIPGLEEAVIGLEPGATRQVVIPPEKGFGQWRPDLIMKFDRQKVPPETDLQVGKELELEMKPGQPLAAEVLDVSEDVITVDANHALAGKQLTLDIQLVEIVSEA
jgi:FKBP-type peptidyl-prolyl cis-trans isomerase 2